VGLAIRRADALGGVMIGPELLLLGVFGVPPLSRRVGYLAPADEAWVPDDWLR
jgi:hypothetical protein